MADVSWNTVSVLELDVSTATVFVEADDRSPKLGGRWLVIESEVWWELPDGAGYRRSIYGQESFPGKDFVPSPA